MCDNYTQTLYKYVSIEEACHCIERSNFQKIQVTNSLHNDQGIFIEFISFSIALSTKEIDFEIFYFQTILVQSLIVACIVCIAMAQEARNCQNEQGEFDQTFCELAGYR